MAYKIKRKKKESLKEATNDYNIQAPMRKDYKGYTSIKGKDYEIIKKLMEENPNLSYTDAIKILRKKEESFKKE